MNVLTFRVTSDAWAEPVTINASDYDPATMTLVEGEAPEAPAEPAPTADVAPPADEQLIVMKSGTGKTAKFFVADLKGAKVTGEAAAALGIDENGYATEDEAKAALVKG